MTSKQWLASISTALVALILLAPAQAANINKSIRIGDGIESDGHSTVNGSISVGSDSTVSGSLETVNGTIRVGQGTVIENADTVNGSIRMDNGVSARNVNGVNGSIRLGEQVTVSGEVSVVNGKIAMDTGTTVAGDVSNVNGEIEISGSEIGGDLTTVTGDIALMGNSVVRGDLVVEEPRGWNSNDSRRKPKVVIGPGAEVVGDVMLEHEVKLYISETAKVGGVSGVMSMDDAIRFSGARP